MAEKALDKNTSLHSLSASGSELAGFRTFLCFFQHLLLICLHLLVPDLHDFPPDGRSPQTITEGQGTFLACQPPPHYPGTSLFHCS